MKKIAYLGIPGSNSYAAAIQFYGTDSQLVGQKKFRDIFEQVTEKTVEQGIIPVENSLAGTVTENYDLLNSFSLQVVGEYYLKFENHLLAVPSTKPIADRLRKITKVYSHPQPLMQCSQFFQQHPQMEGVGFTDTAAAAKFVSEQHDETLAAIGNEEAARLYKLDILQKKIADDNEFNFTRFFIISKAGPIPADADKCSLIFTLQHIPGSLVKALDVFAKNRLSLMKIESRPIHGKPFEYIFHADFMLGKNTVETTKKIIEEFSTTTQTVKVLGFYKSGRLQ